MLLLNEVHTGELKAAGIRASKVCDSYKTFGLSRAERMKCSLALLIVGLLFLCLGAPLASARERSQTRKDATPLYGCKIVNIYPHAPDAFTEGLLFDDGYLFESTGLNGKSTVRKVELETGKVLHSYALPEKYFGEGLTIWQDRLIQLTWQSGLGFIYDKGSFGREGEFTYEGEGWGITHDARSLIISDGTSVLRFLDPDTFEEVRRLEVRDHGSPVVNLNELEYIKGEIFANIWLKDLIARISPQTGQVLGWIDLTDLRNALGPVREAETLNGIAYDASRDRIFVTGKFWPKLFEIEPAPAANR